ncbi:LIM/homeobox protein Lhx9 [Aphelenchoides besseyi]|nr:LIM/homeobox protein Lhx9 [Aphelenchoides besseyi]
MIDAMLFALSALDDTADALGCLAPVQTPLLPVPQLSSITLPSCPSLLEVPNGLTSQQHVPSSSLVMDDKSRMCPNSPCGLCNLPILDRSFLLIGERSWHAQCARCSTCQEPLEQHPTCFFKHGALYCKRDYATKFWRRCCRCFALIEPGSFVISSRDGYFHSECFSCVSCGRILRQGDTYIQGDEGALICQAHCEMILTLPSEPLVENENSSTTMNVETNSSSIDSQSLFSQMPRTSRSSKAAKKAAVEQNLNIFYDSAGDGDNSLIGPHGKTKRMRTSFKHHQLRTMKNYFALNHNPDAKDLKQLAQKTGLTKRVLQVWFQNARAKWRRQSNGREGSTSPSMVGFHSTGVSSENLPAGYVMSSACSPGSAAEGRSFESMSPEVSSGDDSCPKITNSN